VVTNYPSAYSPVTVFEDPYVIAFWTVDTHSSCSTGRCSIL